MRVRPRNPLCKLLLAASVRIHRDQNGSISIVSVFALLLLTFVLGMVMNSTRQVVQKEQMQNAADAATYSAGVVISRNMNTLAYTNHLLAEVFSLTAFMREARDRKAESLTPEILANWERVGPALADSEYPPFADLGQAITEKVPREYEMIYAFSEWAAAASEMILPVCEEILASRMIPEFQRALVATTPQAAQAAMDEVARRHGQSWAKPVTLRGALWRTNADAVGGMSEAERRTLPVVDPVMDEVVNQGDYIRKARRQRQRLAHKYLGAWNDQALGVFDRFGKMSQFSQLWRIFARSNLKQLIDEEYREVNLPFQIRTDVRDIADLNQHLEDDFMFVGVVYREKGDEKIPGVFKNPVAADSQAYAQIMVFVPRGRLEWRRRSSSSSSGDPASTIIPGGRVDIAPPSRDPPPDTDDDETYDVVVRQWSPRYGEQWDLVNQNWTMQLVPATSHSIPRILSTPPYVNGISNVETPDLQNISSEDMHWLNHH